MTEISYSDGTKECYTYDVAGNVKTYTDRNGFSVTYGYDCLGRVVRVEGSGGERKEYAYDAVGNVTKVTDVYNCWNNPLNMVDLNGAWPIWKDIESMINEGIDAVNKAATGFCVNVIDEYNDFVKDLNGTVTFKISANANLYAGVYVDVGLSFDWRGNVAAQWSYAVPGVDNTLSLGICDIGASAGLLFTDASDIYGLLGKSSSIGASGGYLGYGAVDAISFEEMEDMNGDIDGFQMGAGVGAGIDVHMMESYTREICSFNVFQALEKAFNLPLGKREDIKCIEKE